MRQYKKLIHLFENFEILLRKMICLDGKIKRKLKLGNFNMVFKITKKKNLKFT